MSLAGSVRRMGAITAGFGVLGAGGPLLGSVLAGAASWRVSLAVGGVALLALPMVMRRADLTPPPRSAPFDGRGAALLTGSVLSMALAAASARMSRPRVLTILLTVGALAPLTAALIPWGPPLLLVAAPAVFATSAGQATLAVYATAPTPAGLRPTAIGLFNLCYQLGGAFGPAIAAAVVLGG